MTFSILVLKEKHGDQYYDASTPEALAASCAKILKRKSEEGWYERRWPVSSTSVLSIAEKEFMDLTQEQLDALPGRLRSDIMKTIEKARGSIDEREEEKADEAIWFDALEVVLAMPAEKAHELNIGNYDLRYFPLPSGKSTSIAQCLLKLKADDSEHGSFFITEVS
jgi:hypothetical protein